MVLFHCVSLCLQPNGKQPSLVLLITPAIWFQGHVKMSIVTKAYCQSSCLCQLSLCSSGGWKLWIQFWTVLISGAESRDSIRVVLSFCSAPCSSYLTFSTWDPEIATGRLSECMSALLCQRYRFPRMETSSIYRANTGPGHTGWVKYITSFLVKLHHNSTYSTEAARSLLPFMLVTSGKRQKTPDVDRC